MKWLAKPRWQQYNGWPKRWKKPSDGNKQESSLNYESTFLSSVLFSRKSKRCHINVGSLHFCLKCSPHQHHMSNIKSNELMFFFLLQAKQIWVIPVCLRIMLFFVNVPPKCWKPLGYVVLHVQEDNRYSKLSDGYVRREEASIEEVDGVCVYVWDRCMVAVGNTTWHKATATCVRVCVYVPSGIQWWKHSNKTSHRLWNNFANIT